MKAPAVVAALLLLAGCGALGGPLANVEPGERDSAKVDADKFACWQQAELEAGGAHTRTRLMVAPVVVTIGMEASRPDVSTARDQKIERDAEACMIERGYTLRRG